MSSRGVLRLALVAAVATCGFIALPTTGAAAVGSGELEAARARVEQARDAADAAAGRVEEAYSRSQQLADDSAGVEARIAEGRARAAELRRAAQQRAIVAYKRSTEEPVPIFDVEDPDDAARRHEYLERVNAGDDAVVDELHALEEDLEAQREELGRARSRQEEVLAQLRVEQARLEALLAEAEAARRALEERLAREAEARRAAASAAVTSRPRPAGGSQVPGLVCPVPGSAFTDSWGAPRSGGRSHQGTDLMAPYGAPNYAVIGGTASVQSGGNGGMMLYLAGTDGNTYLYAHLQGFAVASGTVSPGQVVAYTGDTGNATGVPHTHFEIRLGGSNPINPYPTLAQVC